jgi:hypothetical protein
MLPMLNQFTLTLVSALLCVSQPAAMQQVDYHALQHQWSLGALVMVSSLLSAVTLTW